MVGFTLKKMANGGMHDHVNQGFHRCSTDRKWHVPYFEKMLYDQGQLAVTFAEIYQITKDEFHANILHDILTYVNRDLSHPMGGFYSAEDADSFPNEGAKEKKAGAFYIWTYEELKKLLAAPVGNRKYMTIGDVFIKHYGVKQNGNIDPRQDPLNKLTKQNVLIVFGSMEETADQFKLSMDETKEILAQCRKILFDERQKRPHPNLDSKMLTAWNGLMISGFAKAAAALNDQTYRDRAIKAAEFIRKHLYDSEKGMLLRICYTEDRQGIMKIKKPITGVAEDYAFLITALLDLYECTFDDQWLKWALELQEKMNELFWDQTEHGYFQTAVGEPGIMAWVKPYLDDAEPSANSMASLNLLRLADFLDKPNFRQKATEIFTAFGKRLIELPVVVPKMVCGFMYSQSGSGQVVITGKDDEQMRMLANAVNSEFLPFKALIVLNGKTDHWLKNVNKHLNELGKGEEKSAAYVCKNFECSTPVHSVEDLKKTLGV